MTEMECLAGSGRAVAAARDMKKARLFIRDYSNMATGLTEVSGLVVADPIPSARIKTVGAGRKGVETPR